MSPVWVGSCTSAFQLRQAFPEHGQCLPCGAGLAHAIRRHSEVPQSHLANRGTGGATLRFGRVWTGAMIVQVALTAIGIPVALESAIEALRTLEIRAEFPGREYLAARIDVERTFEEEATPAFEARRARTFEELQRRIAEEPGVVAVTFADRAPGSAPTTRFGEASPLVTPGRPTTMCYGRRRWDRDSSRRSIVPLSPGVASTGETAAPAPERSSSTRRSRASSHALRDAGRRSALASGIRRRPRDPTRPRQSRGSRSWASCATSAWTLTTGAANGRTCFTRPRRGTLSPFVAIVRVRGDPATLAARLTVIAADVDAGLSVQDARPLNAWIRQRDVSLTMQVGALAGVTSLVLFLSALGIFSLVSVSVSRRTSEIGLRAALGANPRHLLAGILSHAMVLVGSGIAAGAALLLLFVAESRSLEEVALYAGYLGVTSAVMLAACLLACIGPAGRALRINPVDALREA